MSSPQKRTILITGCSSGIGYHCAHALAARGWRVFASCRQQEDCDRLLAEGLETVRLDYTSSASMKAALDDVLAATGGRLDALFNNGAYSHPGAVEDLSTDHVRSLFETNFFGWYELTRRVLPVMRAQGHGRIVQNSSVLGFAAIRFSGAYAASKYAMEGWSDALRLELADTGIHVSIIQPGPIHSRMLLTARARFMNTVDIRQSPFRSDYGREMARMKNGSRSSRYKLGPDAVMTKLTHALEADRPRARYRVTIPARAGALLKRVLTNRAFDRLLLTQR